MRQSLRQWLAAASVLLAGATGAAAEEGFARAASNVRAGPDFEYPVITGVGPGEPVFVYGCLSDYSWCDVRARRVRGWMQASRIELLYGGRRVLVPSYAPRIGLPVVRFDIGTYWDRYYRDYDWYDDRYRYDRGWRNRPDYGRRDYDDRRQPPPVVRVPTPQPQFEEPRRREREPVIIPRGVEEPRRPAPEEFRRRETVVPPQPSVERPREGGGFGGGFGGGPRAVESAPPRAIEGGPRPVEAAPRAREAPPARSGCVRGVGETCEGAPIR